MTNNETYPNPVWYACRFHAEHGGYVSDCAACRSQTEMGRAMNRPTPTTCGTYVNPPDVFSPNAKCVTCGFTRDEHLYGVRAAND